MPVTVDSVAPQPPPPIAPTHTPPPAVAPDPVNVQQPSRAVHGFEIAAWGAGAGLLLLALSPLFKWINFAAGGVTGLSGPIGKIVLGITLVAMAVYIAAMARQKWLTPVCLGVQALATVAVFWMGTLIWKIGSILDSPGMKDNPLAALIATQISPGAGLYLGLIGGIAVAGALGYIAVRHLFGSGSLKPYYATQGLSCVLGILLAFFVGPGHTALDESNHTSKSESIHPSKSASIEMGDLFPGVKEARERAAAQDKWKKDHRVSDKQWDGMIANFKVRKRPDTVSETDWWKEAKDKTPAQLNELYPPLQPREWYRARWIGGLFSRSRELDLYNKNLKITVFIDTEPDVPTREVHGHLAIVKDEKILYETQVAEREDVSFVNGCAVFLKVPYDDNNQTHRTLRYAKDSELKIVFSVSRVVLADGTVKDFAAKHTPRSGADKKPQREAEARADAARKATEEEEAKRREQARSIEEKRREAARLTESVSKNRAALKDPDPKTRLQAAVELGELGPQAGAASPDLGKALDDEDQEVRKAAVDAMGKLGKPAVPALIETLANGSPRSRMNAAHALGLISQGAKEGVPAPDATTLPKLKELFRDANEPTLLVAVMDALAAIRGLDRSMVDQLLTSKGLRHADAAVRSKALDSLRWLGLDTLRVKTLVELNLEDASPEVRERAGKLLNERLDHLSDADMKDVRSLLGMADKPKAVQIGLETVKHLGPKAKEVLPELLRLLPVAKGANKLEMALLLADIDPKDRMVAEAISPILVAALRPETKDDEPSVVVLSSIVAIGQPVVGEIFKALEAAEDRGILTPTIAKRCSWRCNDLAEKPIPRKTSGSCVSTKSRNGIAMSEKQQERRFMPCSRPSNDGPSTTTTVRLLRQKPPNIRSIPRPNPIDVVYPARAYSTSWRQQ